MQRYLIVSMGTVGDVHPYIALGTALQRRGHDVTVATNATFETLVRAAGLDFVSVWSREESERSFANPDLWHPLKGAHISWHHMGDPVMRTTYALVAERARELRDLILVASWSAFGARLANEHLGVPLCTVYLAPANLRMYEAADTAPSVGARMLDAVFGPKLNGFRAQHGLAPITRICDRWMHSPQRGLALFPDWFGGDLNLPAHVSTVSFPLFDEAALHAPNPVLDEFLDAGPRPAVFIAGSEARHARDFFETAMQACMRIGGRAILLSRHEQQIPKPLPPAMLHVDYVPLSRLLPRCAVLAHHGGIGTCAQALQAGIPQLVIPAAFDQFDNAAHIARLGVGASITKARFTVDACVEHLVRLSGDLDVQARCRAIAARCVREDALSAACDVIESIQRTSVARI